ncbi:L-iditol 2-dehydrogenase [Phyllobacterium sp. 1468]|uniref:zinc-dependent alcohol dehydrogenase n=1 Tax=Phyllobacterium sp. 1468 TaxID=2817759 RepID=UPI00285721E4|nr:alcohol dehydrogenase catalytic domain-containing protein [Phyllobacterium sp. 1468]MDR6635687.1 L-iditol 2-dehydrogenase [Phyllobacterium sp. 1468]
MKALVYLGKGSMDYRDVPEPQPGPDEVMLKVHACGICGSDMHGYHGYDARRVPPMIMGHEMAGVVESGAMAGRRVTVNPLLTCGRCTACLSGAPQLCEEQRNIGLPPHTGAFAERIAVPEANVVAIPGSMDFVTAALSEPVAVAYHAVQIGMRGLRRPLSAVRVVVLGGGAIGLATALVAISQGAVSVMLGEKSAVRRATASAASKSITAYEPDSPSEPSPASVDLVFDAVGANETRAAAFKMVRRGGVIVHLGLLPGSEGVDVRRMTLGEIAFIGSYCYSIADFRETVSLLACGRLGPLNWIETRPMYDGAEAFAEIDREEVEAAKIILTN